MGEVPIRAMTSPEPSLPEKKTPGVWSTLKDLLLAVLVVHLMATFMIQPVRVEGTSMQPGLEDQEHVFISRLPCRLTGIQRGDVVVFSLPQDPDKSYIKRVVGLPGETVAIRAGQVFIDNRPLPEPYLRTSFQDRGNTPALRIPSGHYFVLGDHRNVSFDSRDWGPIPSSAISGKAVLKYWPPTDAGVVH